MKKLVAAMLCLALSLMCAVGLANEKIDPSELQIGVIMIGIILAITSANDVVV